MQVVQVQLPNLPPCKPMSVEERRNYAFYSNSMSTVICVAESAAESDFAGEEARALSGMWIQACGR
jgi:hypothetical protein